MNIMKKRIIIFLSAIILFATGCELFVDIDTTDNVSYVSTKPVITLLGDPIISFEVGGNYVEEGVEAYAEDTLLDYEIVSGEVDPNTEGYYVVTYRAVNGFGWESFAYRAVLVHDGTPYEGDISGIYKPNLASPNSMEVSKHSVNGYYDVEAFWFEASEFVDFPIIIADKGDGVHFGIVPSESEDKGRVFGEVVLGSYGGIPTLTFYVEIITPGGATRDKEFIWYKF